MSAGFVAPLAVAIAVAVVAALVQRWLRPDVAATCLAVSCVAVAAASVWVLLALVLGTLAELSWVARWATWCLQLDPAHPHVRVWLGIGAGALLLIAIGRLLRAALLERRTSRQLPRCDDGILIVESDQPAAYAVPGRRGGVVVSTGMIEALAPRERDVMWAHERSHLRHRHHAYLLATELAVAVLPPLRGLADQVRFATERWADEDAASATGGDRSLVARAIARAAIASVDHQRSAMALADTGVGERVRALVDEDRSLLAPITGLAVGSMVIVTSVAGSGIQLHHLVALLQHLCPGS